MHRALLWATALVTACAAPRIPADPILPASSALGAIATVQPCVMVQDSYETDRSDAIEGGEGKTRMVFASILVNHPKHGPIVIDPGVGKEKAHDYGEIPWLLRRIIGDGHAAKPLAETLADAHVAPEAVRWVLVTHMHWDHFAGATDVPLASVVMSATDLAWTRKASVLFWDVTPQDFLERLTGRLKPIPFDGPAYEGFPSSHDLLGDGSVVAVPTPGHTPGSTSWFVNSGDGRRWLFIGDAAFVEEGIRKPAQKGWLVRKADAEGEETASSLALLHAISVARPPTQPPDGKGIDIIVAHDPLSLQKLPACGKP